MEIAYKLLGRARALTEIPAKDVPKGKPQLTVAQIAREAGLSDATVRALLKPGLKLKTLENLCALEGAVVRLEASYRKKAPRKGKTNG